MRRLFALLLILALALGLAACGSQGGSKAADPLALGEELKSRAEGLPDMTTVSSGGDEATGAELFPYLSDMDYSKVAGYYLSYATAGSPEEIALIRVKDASDLAEARASLERHLENRRNIFRTYDPAGAALLDKARITASGDLAAIIVCENSDELERELRKTIS